MTGNSWIASRWTNNNSESVNNLLKVAADWKQLPTSSVIDNVCDVVRVQYSDARRALCGQGNFVLAPAFSRHSVTYLKWTGLDDKQKDDQFRRFMKDNGQRQCDTHLLLSCLLTA